MDGNVVASDHNYCQDMTDDDINCDHTYSKAVPVGQSVNIDHCYSVQMASGCQQKRKTVNLEEIYEKHRVDFNRSKECTTDLDYVKNVFKSSTSTENFIHTLLDIPDIRNVVEKKILDKLDFEIQNITKTSFNSVQRKTLNNDLSVEKVLTEMVNEVTTHCPFLVQTLMVSTGIMYCRSAKVNVSVPAIIGMLMYGRNKQMCIIQKLLTAACTRYHANNDLLAILHKFSMTVHEANKNRLLDDIGATTDSKLLSALQLGLSLKITVDNIDGRILANQVRFNSGNRDYHHTHWTIIPDRFTEADLQSLSNKKEYVPEPDLSVFYVNDHELEQLRYSYTMMLANILIDEMEGFKVFKSSLPARNHRFSHIASRKSDVYPMFIIMEDSKSLPSCVRIMDTITQHLQKLFREAGREFENVNFTIGGDQLTRTNLDSAKNLRRGAHTAIERLEQLTPILEEFFHVEQDLLSKIVKKYYKQESARNEGVLSHYKTILHRTNVNGNVKTSNGFEPHREFVFLVTKMLLVNFVCTKLDMQVNDYVPDMPQTLKFWKKEKKFEWLREKLAPIVELLLTQYKPPVCSTTITVQDGQVVRKFHVPQHNAGKKAALKLTDKVIIVDIPKIEGCRQDTKSGDSVFNYSLSFLRSSMILMNLHHATKAADIDILTIICKQLIPQFVGLHSFQSKYAIEMINFLTKTELILSQQESVAVKLRAFVNNKGELLTNKCADMQQENNIKKIKDIIKGLGAGKNEATMKRCSKAAPIVNSVVNDLSQAVGILKKDKRHGKKSDNEDKEILLQEIIACDPFKMLGRNVAAINDIEPCATYNVNVDKFNGFLRRHCQRAYLV